MNAIRFIITFIIVISPVLVSAEIRINEIMYDHEGTDSGNEWIEIHNIGTESIDLEDWAFRENDVNHGLQFEESTIIEANSYMVIVQNVEQFRSIYGTAPKLIKSSFSLNNTGELLEIVNGNDEVVDSHRYTSETGGSGDGLSLQLMQNSWEAGSPSPGSQNNADKNENSDIPRNSTSSSGKKSSSNFERYYEAYIEVPKAVTEQSLIDIEAGAFHVHEHSRVRKKRGLYYLNLGDGTVIESTERIDIQHRYYAAGSYILTLEYYVSDLQREKGDPEFVYQKSIEVYAAEVGIVGEDGNGALVLENYGKQNIDVSGWLLVGKGFSYTFPKYSVIRAESQIAISYDTLGFWVDADIIDSMRLVNDNGMLVYQYHSPSTERIAKKESINDIDLGPNTINLDEELEPDYQLDVDEGEQEHPLESQESQLVWIFMSGFVVVMVAVRYTYKSKQKRH